MIGGAKTHELLQPSTRLSSVGDIAIARMMLNAGRGRLAGMPYSRSKSGNGQDRSK
jgi:hypothetical protein